MHAGFLMGPLDSVQPFVPVPPLVNFYACRFFIGSLLFGPVFRFFFFTAINSSRDCKDQHQFVNWRATNCASFQPSQNLMMMIQRRPTQTLGRHAKMDIEHEISAELTICKLIYCTLIFSLSWISNAGLIWVIIVRKKGLARVLLAQSNIVSAYQIQLVPLRARFHYTIIFMICTVEDELTLERWRYRPFFPQHYTHPFNMHSSIITVISNVRDCFTDRRLIY